MMPSRANSLEHPLHQFAAVPLSRETLDEVLAGYRRPNDKVSEWMRTGALESLRRGLYLTGEPLRQASACLPLVANHLYGPSCVSLDTALAWHGLIPEGVVEVTSVTPRPSRILQNARGRFSYHHLPLTYYTVGQELGASSDGLSFLITSPAKALCDRLVLARNLPLLSRSAMRQWLLDDLRLDPEWLSAMDLTDVRACLVTGLKRRQLGTLLAVLERLQQELAG
ncbi:MAG: hypothetical protein ACH34U_10600 [Cyanobium sp.]